MKRRDVYPVIGSGLLNTLVVLIQIVKHMRKKMLEYVPFKQNSVFGKTSFTHFFIDKFLVSYVGGKMPKPHPLSIKQGLFLYDKDKDWYWLENKVFTHCIKFHESMTWRNKGIAYDVEIPKLGVHATVTGDRFSSIIHKANMLDGILTNVKFRFNRRGATCFLEFV